MLKRLTEKLNSNSGVTIIMALLLMFVAVTASAVIITSAQSAAMNVKATEKDQQAILSVSSAANYIENELKKCEVTRKYKADYDYDYEVDKGKTNKSAFYPEIKTLFNEIKNDTSKDIVNDSFYINLNNLNVDKTKLLPVKVELEFNRTYDLIIKYSIDSNNGSQLKIKQVFYSHIEKNQTDSNIDTITWPECDIYRETT